MERIARTPPPRRRAPARWRLFGLLLALGLAGAGIAPGRAGEPAPAGKPLTFGILPIGGPSESLEAWRPMLDDMQLALQRPVRSISVSTYEGLAQALAEDRVDMAFVSGRMALDAVLHDRMQVIAQLTRGDGSRGYCAVLLVEKDSPIRGVDDLLRRPNHWRYGRGESLSVSGYLVPETQLFAPRGLDSDTFFASVAVNNHQNNALAVANGEVDVASNNTADLERFRDHFPEQYARLRVLWKSALIPHAVIVVRSALAPELRARVVDFITHYAKRGRGAAAELAKLHLIHDISGFAPAGNDTLVPFADIEYSLERRRALGAQWVSATALQARLQRIEEDHRELVRQLQDHRPLPPSQRSDSP
ncbi:phosphate/phosphite/phosphonate ABC transporter substrate-binding protein [Fulvimonas soli]|jgi:phosphonate transport system substrate-binding protein|uniref:Phosphonate transport system substrate-binding protein n=1 Tax=Fulvimonas soli TaxID=155197 RepID=A0A316I535_9GAMM|nr:phosphate/phosphite/phosphonate ABC transporter substrate-binding protein [Fulvimonas soli]PWK88527.1 phosphonate transport system substrate-binding protein [Fulvimonas soli]TNY27469.1 phosphonate ABC transporter substrate-binding protein [Fulvimonas soli]